MTERTPPSTPPAGSYAGYDVLDKWRSPSFDGVTRRTLTQRLHAVPGRSFLSPDLYAVLEAACARVIPQPDRAEPVPIAPWIDDALQRGSGDGFRPPDTPPPREAWTVGLRGLDAEARARFLRPFVELDPDSQDAVLKALQDGEADPGRFPGLPADHFMVHMLAKESAGHYYAHPEAWSEIGFGGPASPRGYVRLGLDKRDPWEAPIVPAPGDGL